MLIILLFEEKKKVINFVFKKLPELRDLRQCLSTCGSGTHVGSPGITMGSLEKSPPSIDSAPKMMHPGQICGFFLTNLFSKNMDFRFFFLLVFRAVCPIF